MLRFFYYRRFCLVSCPQCCCVFRSPRGCYRSRTITCPCCGIEVNRVR